MASIFDLFNNSNAQDAANAQTQGINIGQAQATNALNTGLSQATNSYNAGLQPAQTNSAAANQGVNALGNLLGLNGAAGNASATQQLQNTPGYQFALDQGSQNVMRNQAATGQLASGATDVALQNLGQNTATAAAYQPYLQSLQQYLPYSTQNAQTQAGLYSGLAGTQAGVGSQQASLDYGAQTSIGNAQANADLANNNAAANLFGGITSLASLGAKAAPTIGSSLASLFI